MPRGIPARRPSRRREPVVPSNLWREHHDRLVEILGNGELGGQDPALGVDDKPRRGPGRRCGLGPFGSRRDARPFRFAPRPGAATFATAA